MKYKIQKYTAIATWHWAIPDKACSICRQDFDAPCATSKCRFPGDDCPIIFGKCKHYFHLHCIHSWNKEQNAPTCPLCRAPWEIDAAGNDGQSANDNANATDNANDTGQVNTANAEDGNSSDQMHDGENDEQSHANSNNITNSRIQVHLDEGVTSSTVESIVGSSTRGSAARMTSRLSALSERMADEGRSAEDSSSRASSDW